MATKSRTLKQAKFDRRALKLLRAKELYSGKIDLRKAPTSYQNRLIKKFDALIRGKASLVKPKNPQNYKGTFQVIRDKVIVPRRKGEKVFINKAGGISRKRTEGGLKVRTRFIEKADQAEIARPSKLTMYHVPFNRPGGDLEWRRFTYDALQKFKAEYGERAGKRGRKGRADFREWMNTIEVEEIEFRNQKKMAAFKKRHDALIFGEPIDGGE